MSANHVPMHDAGSCLRCDRRKLRVDAYAGRMAHRATAKGEKELLQREVRRIQRARAYSVGPVDPVNGRPHRHEPGRRQRMKAQRQHHQHQLAAVGELRALAKRGPSEPRRLHAYCDGLGHKWSGPKWANAEGAMRVCERGSCRASEFIHPTKPAAAAA
jgi:hypothetical protein